jgi:HlyD family secretion protein
MKKLLRIVIPIAILAVAGWWFFLRTPEDTAADPFVREAVAHRGDLVVSISATGIINPIEQVEVKSKASGEVITLPIEVGDYVHKGDLIARLDRNTAQNDFDQATADHAVAKVTAEQQERELKRQESLFEKGLTSESVLDAARLADEQAKAQLIRAKSALSTAKERLDDTEIHAPINGIVLTRPVEIGQIISSGTTTVTGGTLLCTIANMNEVYVVADVDETDIGKVEVGMPASINADAYPDLNLDGKVLRIAPLAKVEQNVTMFEVTSLVNNEEGLLKAGMNATVEVIMARADDALLIPAKAVTLKPPPRKPDVTDTSSEGALAQADQNGREHRGPGMRPPGGRARPNGDGAMHHPRGEGRMVPSVQVRRNGSLEWTPVKTGLSDLDNIEILHGLAEGDTVVYSLVSGVMQAREEFRERMRNRTAVPGMRRSN